eukprot:2984274-Amphidinium_carterae.1
MAHFVGSLPSSSGLFSSPAVCFDPPARFTLSIILVSGALAALDATKHPSIYQSLQKELTALAPVAEDRRPLPARLAGAQSWLGKQSLRLEAAQQACRVAHDARDKAIASVADAQAEVARLEQEVLTEQRQHLGLVDLHASLAQIMSHVQATASTHGWDSSHPLHGPVSYTHLTLPTILLV